MMTGCSKENGHGPSEKNLEQEELEQEEIEANIQQLHVDAKTFHMVVDWLSDEEILFVEKEESIYVLKVFNIKTEEMKTIFEESAIMTNVLVHPTKKYLLLHTSTDASAATVKMITLDGVIQNEVTIESAELEIEWNDINPLHILFTAFYEDWSFDTFFFHASNHTLQLLPVEDPFPKWFGEYQFVMSGEELGTLALYDVDTREKTLLAHEDVIQYDTFKDALLTIQEAEEEQVQYTILNSNGHITAQATMSGARDEFESTPSNIEWIAENQLLFFHSKNSHDELGVAAPNHLMMLDGNGVEVISENTENSTMLCSPTGESCLTGVYLEEILHMKDQEESTWLIYEELVQ